jgi:hypothetical protein
LFKAHTGGAAKRGATGQAENASDIGERLQRAVFKPEDLGLLAGFFNHEIAEEGKWRKISQTIVGKNAKKRRLGVQLGTDVRLQLAEEALGSLNRAQIEERARLVDLRADGVADPAGEAGLPLIETAGGEWFGREIAALGESRGERCGRVAKYCNGRSDEREKLPAPGGSIETPELLGAVLPGDLKQALQNAAVHEIGEGSEPIEGRGCHQTLEYPGAGALIELAEGFDAWREGDLLKDIAGMIAEGGGEDRGRDDVMDGGVRGGFAGDRRGIGTRFGHRQNAIGY